MLELLCASLRLFASSGSNSLPVLTPEIAKDAENRRVSAVTLSGESADSDSPQGCRMETQVQSYARIALRISASLRPLRSESLGFKRRRSKDAETAEFLGPFT